MLPVWEKSTGILPDMQTRGPLEAGLPPVPMGTLGPQTNDGQEDRRLMGPGTFPGSPGIPGPFSGGAETERGPVGLPGTEALLSPVSCRQDSSLHDLPRVPKGRSEQLLIKGGAARKPPEARLKGPEKLIKIRTHHLRRD